MVQGNEMLPGLKNDKHFELIRRGLALHENRDYAKALSFFEKGLTLSPFCPVAIFNQANTLYMLTRNEQARSILLNLVNTPEAALRAGCPDMAETPRSLCLGAFNLLFLSTLYSTKSWHEASPYLREHLRRRARGLQSLWAKPEIIHDADKLRQEFAPKAKPVKDWVL